MENNTLCNRHSLGVNNHTKMYVTYTRIYGWSDYGGESSYQPGYRLENMMWMTLLVYDYIIPGEKIMLIVREFSNRFQQMSGMPINSNETKERLKAAGIDINSKQYRAVMSEMSRDGGGGYTTISAIKKRMSRYDKDGDWINPRTGLAGLLVTDKNCASKNRIVSISESIMDEMFESTKKEFFMENGVHNGDTTNRSEIYQKLYQQTEKNDRLAAGYTLEEYERQYWQAFTDAVKVADPKWEAGKPIMPGVLDRITSKSIDALLVKSGSQLIRKSFERMI